MTLGPRDLLSFHTRSPLVHTVVISSRNLTYQQVQQLSCLPHLQEIDFNEAGLARWIQPSEASTAGSHTRRKCAFAHLTQVSSLHFRETKSASWWSTDFHGLSCLQRLRHLSLHVQPQNTPVEALPSLSALTALTVSALHTSLAQLSQLQYLCLRLSDSVGSFRKQSTPAAALYGGEPVPKEFSNLSCLSSLTIDTEGYNRTPIASNQLRSLSAFGALEHLKINKTITKNAYFALIDLDSIRSLELYQQHPSLIAFGFLGIMTQLTSLHFYAIPRLVYHDHNTPSAMKQLVILYGLKNLVHLKLKVHYNFPDGQSWIEKLMRSAGTQKQVSLQRCPECEVCRRLNQQESDQTVSILP